MLETSMLPCTVVNVPGACNVRDLGGYAGENGLPFAYGRFFRAGAMHSLDARGIHAIRTLGVGRIIDLRSQFEASRWPDTLRDDPDIDYIHIPMLDRANSVESEKEDFPNSLEEMYIGLLENHKGCFRRLIQALADPAVDTVLFHCTSGKDRTGLTAMLLLGFAGVSRTDIVADYTPSEWLAAKKPPHSSIPSYMFESRAETMHATLDYLKALYGGVRQYLSAIGVDAQTAAYLRHKCFCPVQTPNLAEVFR